MVARHFSVADYGLIDLMSTVVALLTTVIVFGQDSAVGRYFYEYTSTSARGQVISQSMWVQVGLCAVVSIFILVAWPLWRLLFGDFESDEFDLLLVLVLLQVPFNVLLNFSQNLLKWTFERRAFLLVSFGATVASAGGVVVGIRLFDFGLVGVFTTYLVTRLFFAPMGVYLCRRWLILPRNFGYAREMLPFAVSFGVICVIASFVPLMQRVLTNGVLGAEDLGLLAAGAKVAALISLPIAAFQTAWGPFSLAIHKEPNAVLTYGVVLKAFTLVISMCLLVLTFLAEPMIRVLAGDRYAAASIVVFPIALGLMLQGIGWITEIGIGIAKKAHLQLKAYVIYLVVTTLAIVALAKVFGLVGVACGTLLGYLVKAIYSSYLAQSVHPISWPFRSVGILLIPVALVGTVGAILSRHVTPLENGVILLIACAAVAGMGWGIALQKRERMAVRRFIVQWIAQ